jgi:hypothetical protein
MVDRARVRGLRRQGRGEPVRGWADEALAEGEAEGLDRRRGWLAAANQRGATRTLTIRFRRFMASR